MDVLATHVRLYSSSAFVAGGRCLCFPFGCPGIKAPSVFPVLNSSPEAMMFPGPSYIKGKEQRANNKRCTMEERQSGSAFVEPPDQKFVAAAATPGAPTCYYRY